MWNHFKSCEGLRTRNLETHILKRFEWISKRIWDTLLGNESGTRPRVALLGGCRTVADTRNQNPSGRKTLRTRSRRLSGGQQIGKNQNKDAADADCKNLRNSYLHVREVFRREEIRQVILNGALRSGALEEEVVFGRLELLHLLGRNKGIQSMYEYKISPKYQI